MEYEKLKGYLHDVSELEQTEYTIKDIISSLDSEISTQRIYPYKPPQEPYAPTYYETKPKYKILKYFLIVYLFCGLFMIPTIFFSPIAIIPTIIYLLIAIVGIILINSKNKKSKKENENSYKIELAEYEKNKSNYIIQMQKYNNAVDLFNKNRQTSIIILKNKRNDWHKMLNEVDSILQELYSLNIVPKSYQSLVPVTMFYDYILNKRTYSLERNNNDPGAINMYEDEKFKKLILTSLSEIKLNLLHIQDNQRVLYNVIEESNERKEQLLSSISSELNYSNSLRESNNRTSEEQLYQQQIQNKLNNDRNNIMRSAYYGYSSV